VNNIKQETYNRSNIEKSLKKEFPNLTKSEITNAINIVLESIIETVALDGKIEIRGFGTFSKKSIRPRKFINPKTKKISYLGETSTMHFKPSKFLIKK
jgi:Bacterial nucleoid DNA-binding protein